MHAPRLAKTPASRSRQAEQATPKGLLRLPRATESHAAKRYDIEGKKDPVWSCTTECEFANPLLDVNAIVSHQLHVRSSNLYLKLPFARSEIQKCLFQAL